MTTGWRRWWRKGAWPRGTCKSPIPQERGYPYQSLVAFSGTVRDVGIDYTEANMNGYSEKQTADVFKRSEYRFLIVANKFQTGFD